MANDLAMIMDMLLDRYERSRHYREPGASPRGVFIRYDRATMPDYWDERRGDRRAELNQATRELAARGLVRVRASAYSREEIERVDLDVSRVSEAYAVAGRIPRRRQEAELARTAEGWGARWPDPADWRRQFCERVETAVQTGEPLPAGLRHDSGALLEELCRVLEYLGPSGLAEEVPRRIFSQRALGDSKRFEAIQGSVVRLLREFWSGALPADDRDALAELGVVENPQHVFIAGPVVLDGLNVGAVGAEIGLPTVFVERCKVTSVEADTVITVENLTSFHQLVRCLPARTVAVYLGGYHNRVRRRMLLKLAEAGVDQFRHWGDIDLGGFGIFVHLRRVTGLPLTPWLMDEETFRSHADRGKTFGDGYRRKLEALLKDPEYECFYQAMGEMLEVERTVEQEAVDPASYGME